MAMISGLYGNPPARRTRNATPKKGKAKTKTFRRGWVYGTGKKWKGEREDYGLLVLSSDHAISSGYFRDSYKH